jgi:hypothetical protein
MPLRSIDVRLDLGPQLVELGLLRDEVRVDAVDARVHGLEAVAGGLDEPVLALDDPVALDHGETERALSHFGA